MRLLLATASLFLTSLALNSPAQTNSASAVKIPKAEVDLVFADVVLVENGYINLIQAFVSGDRWIPAEILASDREQKTRALFTSMQTDMAASISKSTSPVPCSKFVRPYAQALRIIARALATEKAGTLTEVEHENLRKEWAAAQNDRIKFEVDYFRCFQLHFTELNTK